MTRGRESIPKVCEECSFLCFGLSAEAILSCITFGWCLSGAGQRCIAVRSRFWRVGCSIFFFV